MGNCFGGSSSEKGQTSGASVPDAAAHAKPRAPSGTSPVVPLTSAEQQQGAQRVPDKPAEKTVEKPDPVPISVPAPTSSPAPVPVPSPPSTQPEGDSAEAVASAKALKIFTLKELLDATNNFKEPDNVLGEGGFGKVYKGWLPNKADPTRGSSVAVKRLAENSKQGMHEFLSEINTLGSLRHENLVRLHGFCLDKNSAFLVYDYVKRGSLDVLLAGDGGERGDAETTPIAWDDRLKIAYGAARGLAFLHGLNIVHRDFKPSNILLDEEYNAKLTDFGLAKILDAGASHASTRIMGSLGYLDPKYVETGELTKKSDVYGFGIMLLELLTGRPATDFSQEEECNLAQWATPYLVVRKAEIFNILDVRIQSQFENPHALRNAKKLALVARYCISEDSSIRPDMKDLVPQLERLVTTRLQQSASQSDTPLGGSGAQVSR
eukprot:TRINITY_DN2262_c0_g5_i1.p1 TRINITY_DN2262_c0_g5~~TRINITY_DN2262_c0_g5_i1.p1  ORF type:complete len:435 (-),score=89.90 TRINITY_DN2262_c0_g5_i1:1362-2666(-)